MISDIKALPPFLPTPPSSPLCVPDLRNAFLLRPLLKWLCGPLALQQGARSEEWVLPLVHGYFKQRTIQLATSQARHLVTFGVDRRALLSIFSII
jgi:hypothetical protein